MHDVLVRLEQLPVVRAAEVAVRLRAAPARRGDVRREGRGRLATREPFEGQAGNMVSNTVWTPKNGLKGCGKLNVSA